MLQNRFLVQRIIPLIDSKYIRLILCKGLNVYSSKHWRFCFFYCDIPVYLDIGIDIFEILNVLFKCKRTQIKIMMSITSIGKFIMMYEQTTQKSRRWRF